MARAEFHVFGLGWGADDLRYVGWTRRSPTDEAAQIFTDLVAGGGRDIAHWIAEGLRRGIVNLFELESAPSPEEASATADSLCRYFNSLGLEVATVQTAPGHPAAPARVADRRCHAEDARVPA
jgi:hypothetical protein